MTYSEEVTCDEPLLTVDRQMGLNIIHPDGKVRRPLCGLLDATHADSSDISQPATTIFQRIRYDPNTDTSVLHCESTVV